MRFSLFPKTVKFYDLFAKQSAKTLEAASLLSEIFSDFSDCSDKCAKINAAEAEGNAIFREIAAQLSLTFITPIDKEDIHEINLIQEDVLNLIKAISTSTEGMLGAFKTRKLAWR